MCEFRYSTESGIRLIDCTILTIFIIISGSFLPRNLSLLKAAKSNENSKRNNSPKIGDIFEKEPDTKGEEMKSEALKKIKILQSGKPLEDDVTLNVPEGPIRRKFGNDPCFQVKLPPKFFLIHACMAQFLKRELKS